VTDLGLIILAVSTMAAVSAGSIVDLARSILPRRRVEQLRASVPADKAEQAFYSAQADNSIRDAVFRDELADDLIVHGLNPGHWYLDDLRSSALDARVTARQWRQKADAGATDWLVDWPAVPVSADSEPTAEHPAVKIS
jgi:hypothetical protein